MSSNVRMTHDGYTGSLTIDGTDVTEAVSREFSLSLRRDDTIPRLEVRLIAPELDYYGEADVSLNLSMGAEAVLRAAGWVRKDEVQA